MCESARSAVFDAERQTRAAITARFAFTQQVVPEVFWDHLFLPAGLFPLG
jgi:hypothetical protein